MGFKFILEQRFPLVFIYFGNSTAGTGWEVEQLAVYYVSVDNHWEVSGGTRPFHLSVLCPWSKQINTRGKRWAWSDWSLTKLQNILNIWLKRGVAAGPGTRLPTSLICRGTRPRESDWSGFVPIGPVPHVREERLRGEAEVPAREVRPREQSYEKRFADGCYAKKPGG